MRTGWAVIIGAVLIAASILFIGRWEITATAYGYNGGEGNGDTTSQTVYRLDRWSGRTEACVAVSLENSEASKEMDAGRLAIRCIKMQELKSNQ